MLSKGLKIVIETTEQDVKAEVIINIFNILCSFGINFLQWNCSVIKKAYLIKIKVGPFYCSLINLCKMNSILDSYLEDKID